MAQPGWAHQLTIGGREWLVAVAPLEDGLVMEMLRYAKRAAGSSGAPVAIHKQHAGVRAKGWSEQKRLSRGPFTLHLREVSFVLCAFTGAIAQLVLEADLLWFLPTASRVAEAHGGPEKLLVATAERESA